jgi:diadenosine tetraphosphatase ApaH/serine/threonine PP2A family protein phosphatase
MMETSTGYQVRFLLLSDIHANLDALEACLAAAPAYDAVANLGDIVGYGACPNEVIERSRELGTLFVRGNHDKACAGIMDVRGFNYVAAAAVVWTNHALKPENLQWLKEMPQGPLPLAPLKDAQVAHGSPRDEDEYLLASDNAAVSAVVTQVPITFFGHTHMQGGFRISDGQEATFRPEHDEDGDVVNFEYPLARTGKYLINPGSVGQPRDGDWRAAFALYDSDARSVNFFRVKYDVEKAAQRIREAGLPDRLADRLSVGR